VIGGIQPPVLAAGCDELFLGRIADPQGGNRMEVGGGLGGLDGEGVAGRVIVTGAGGAIRVGSLDVLEKASLRA
jgi:hypothetical protein